MEDSTKAKKRPSKAGGPDAKRANLTIRSLNVPLMSQEEVQQITVSLDRAPQKLKSIMEVHGVAVVTGAVATDAELESLEALFRGDLEHLLAAHGDDSGAARAAAAAGANTGKVVQCEGRTKKGERCTVTSDMAGLMSKYSRPLKSGSRFCSRHAPAVDEASLPDPASLKPREGPPLRLEDWPLASLEELGQGERCSQRGLPHGRFAWACRRLSAVRKCYEILHGTDDLVTGLDNTFFVPQTATSQKTNREWPHVGTLFKPNIEVRPSAPGHYHYILASFGTTGLKRTWDDKET
eukprot:TRINITY_DN14725_c0_g1_i1.p1 TRINITY_DN14725_c0_g1~~TRINITY_DN14725_c0_g1_i1.p1  ORF type:complete len:309 (-),score=53.00 TRINITY_DN14725_c0_g1_i1:93-974(-)